MRNRVIIAVLLLVIVLSPVTLNCSGPSSIARDVAEEWTHDEDNVVSISEELANLVLENIAGVAPVQKLNIKNQIGGKLFWQYSKASELAANSYTIIATANVQILNIPLVGIFNISADYQLTIDTAARVVSDWEIDESSFDVSTTQSHD